MPEEIFRFSVVRNPQSVTSEQLNSGVLNVLPEVAEQDLPYHKSLVALKQQGIPRRGIVDHAKRMIDDSRYVLNLQSLGTSLWKFTERLYLLKKPSRSGIRQLATEIFGNINNLVASDAFAKDRRLVADSLVLASVTTPSVPGLRTRLMQGRRAIAILEQLADLGEENTGLTKPEKLLTATVLLPSDLFPIPNSNKERDESNRKEYDSRKEALEKERQRAQDLLNQIARNEAAAKELSATLSEHLFETKHQPKNTLSASLSVLPRGRFEALSASSKRIVLEELSIPASSVDVPHVVDRLEKANTSLNSQLGIQLGDLLLDAGPFYFPPVCGECNPVVLPEPKAENSFTPDTRGKVEVVGTQELLIVRQKLLTYRPGEIAHIENVLKGEQKAKKHRKLHRTEVTLVEETEREEEVEKELQTADKYELQTESSRVISEDRSVDAGVTVTASYGPVDIEAHGNYAQNSSTSESRSAASTFARDVISRSLQRIRERIMTRRSRTDITEVEIINEHQFNNTDGTEHVAGIYRWVDKYYEAQIVNYGKRTMLEFMIPEPSAFYKFAASNKPAPKAAMSKPDRPGFCRNGVFHPLTPGDLQPENYMCFVGKYNVKNITAPSPRYVKISDLIKHKVDSASGGPVTIAESNDSFKVPEGYLPKAVNYAITGGNSHSAKTGGDTDDMILVVIAIGDRKVFRYYKNEIGQAGGGDSWPDLTQVIEWGNALSQREKDFGSYSIGNLADAFAIDPSNGDLTDNPNVVKVSITGHTTLSMSVTVHYSVLCERSAEKFQQWQIDTYNAIQEAYVALKKEYDSSQQNDDFSGFVNIQGRNPQINREVEKKELKKFSISLLTGQQFESFNAMEEDYRLHIPQIDLLDAAAEGSFVRFFEQALEWKHMTYLFYPYFWGNKKNWVGNMAVKDTDPLFEQFLQAGYARVWVPVRPGFDLVMAHYIECGGEPWTERDAPICGQPSAESAPMVAMIEEIKEQLGADFEFRPGTVAVRDGETLVVGTGTDFRADDVDREILISLKYYRIAEVDEAAQQIRLREAYTGEDLEGIGVAVGVKFVGEPWVVQVPTDLVFLESGTELIAG